MSIEAQGEVTRLLEQIAAANDNEDTKRASEAKQALFDVVYNELKQMAQSRMRWQRPDHSWGATGLVHEVYCRLVTERDLFTKNRAYFFGAAARAMGQLLWKHARKRQSCPLDRPDPQGHILLDQIAEEVEDTFKVDLLELMNALDKLKATGEHGERRHNVVWLRIWSGLKYPEIARDLGISVATVERDWQAARAWLYGQLMGEDK
jgi:RNA polymerase sigma factor (TIGR02999 family)